MMVTFACPSPAGCPPGPGYIANIQLSSTAGTQLLGEASVNAGLRSNAADASAVTVSFLGLLPGWHLVALPPASNISSGPELLFTLPPGNTAYQAVQPGQTTTAGLGYWFYVATPIVVTLPPDGDSAFSQTVPAGSWTMVGNPSGIWPAQINGADAVYTYDQNQGYAPANSILLTGQAAMVYSAQGATITANPEVP